MSLVPVALDQNASIALPAPRVRTVCPVAVETSSMPPRAGALSALSNSMIRLAPGATVMSASPPPSDALPGTRLLAARLAPGAAVSSTRVSRTPELSSGQPAGRFPTGIWNTSVRSFVQAKLAWVDSKSHSEPTSGQVHFRDVPFARLTTCRSEPWVQGGLPSLASASWLPLGDSAMPVSTPGCAVTGRDSGVSWA